MERHGWNSLDDFRGIRRDRVVAHSKIRRPDADAYRGGYDAEGYAARRSPPRVERLRPSERGGSEQEVRRSEAAR